MPGQMIPCLVHLGFCCFQNVGKQLLTVKSFCEKLCVLRIHARYLSMSYLYAYIYKCIYTCISIFKLCILISTNKMLINIHPPRLQQSRPAREPLGFSQKFRRCFFNESPGLVVHNLDSIGWPWPFLLSGVSKNRGTPKWMVYNGKPY